jgi:hypothetical protein
MSRLLFAVLLAGCAPSTLAEAIRNNPDEFPPPYAAVRPPSSASALGAELAEGGEHPDGITLSATSCFKVGVTERKKGLDTLRVHYRSTTKLRAELQYVALGAGAGIEDGRGADLVLLDLVHERGTPRPAPGDCDFPANAVHRIVTSQVRAGSATLDFRRQSALTGQAQVPVAQTGADVNAATGWTRSSSRSLGGRDIVLAGMLERWRVEVDRHEHNLGPTPEFGRALTVGRSLLRVSVLGYDSKRNALAVRVDAPDAKPSPEEAGTCSLATNVSLVFDPRAGERGSSCLFWAPSSGSSVWIAWELRANPEAPTVQDLIVTTDLYQTRPCTASTCPPP